MLKNRDVVPPELLTLLAQSDDHFTAKLTDLLDGTNSNIINNNDSKLDRTLSMNQSFPSEEFSSFNTSPSHGVKNASFLNNNLTSPVPRSQFSATLNLHKKTPTPHVKNIKWSSSPNLITSSSSLFTPNMSPCVGSLRRSTRKASALIIICIIISTFLALTEVKLYTWIIN